MIPGRVAVQWWLSQCPCPCCTGKCELRLWGEGWARVPHPFLPPRQPHGGLIFVRVCFNAAYGLHYTQTSHFHNYTMMGVPVKAIKQILFPRPVPPPPPALPIKLAGVPVCEEKEKPRARTVNPLQSRRKARLSPAARRGRRGSSTFWPRHKERGEVAMPKLCHGERRGKLQLDPVPSWPAFRGVQAPLGSARQLFHSAQPRCPAV